MTRSDRILKTAAVVAVVAITVMLVTLAAWLVGAFLRTASCDLFGVWCSEYSTSHPLFPVQP